MHLLRLLVPGAVALGLLAAACGGGDDDRGASPAASVTAEGTQGSDGPAATPSVSPTATPEPVLATPTPLPDDLPLLQVAAAGQLYEPLASDFQALPQQTITIEGRDYRGVLLETLSLKVPADPEAVVTIEGIRSDGVRYNAIRFPLSDVGSSTVLYVAENGHLNLASTSIPRDQWLLSVTSVAFE